MRSAATRRKARPTCWPPCRRHALPGRVSRGRAGRGADRRAQAAALREEGFVRVIVVAGSSRLRRFGPSSGCRICHGGASRPDAMRTALRGRRSPGRRQRQPAAGPRFAGNRFRQGQRTLLGLCRPAGCHRRLAQQCEPPTARHGWTTGSGTQHETGEPETAPEPACARRPRLRVVVDGRPWRRLGFSTQLACEDCGIEYPLPEPRLYSFNSPLGACPACEGFGNVIDIDMDLVVPDREQVAPRRGHRPLEHAGLRARAGRVAGLGRRLRHAGRRALLAS